MQFPGGGDLLASKGKNVVFYSIPNNPECQRVRQFLTLNGALFTEVDVTQSAFAAEQLIRKTGSVAVPVVEVNGMLVQGTSEAQLKKVLSASSTQ